MNKKQWFVLGIGLLVFSYFLLNMSTKRDCLELQGEYDDLRNEAVDAGFDYADYNNDVWVISCFEQNMDLASDSSIFFTIGILFIICGFLEGKKKG